MIDVAAASTRTHPELLRRYRAAKQAWDENPDLVEACRVIGMGPQEWAARYVDQYGPIAFVPSNNTTYLFFGEQAFKEVWSESHG